MRILRRSGIHEACGQRRHAQLVSHRPAIAAFTLLEVMIAMAIFFIVTFAILNVVVQSLAAARALQIRHPDAGMLAAQLSLTNCLVEGSESGDFEDLFPNSYWERAITPAGSNSLWLVEFAVFDRSGKGKTAAETMSVLMFKPACGGAGRGVR